MDSKYCYQPAGHLVTWNLKIITDSKIWSFICKGPKHRASLPIDLKNRAVRKLLAPWKVSYILGCKDQESIQSSITPDQGYQWESDKLTVRHHKREPRGQCIMPQIVGNRILLKLLMVEFHFIATV